SRERMAANSPPPPIHSRSDTLRGMSPSSAASVTGANSARDPWYLATTPLETGPWLVRMRWATVVVELLLLAMTFALPALDLPLDHIAWLILVDATMNAIVARHLAVGGSSRWPLAIALAIQVLLITALIELTGGPSNPFVVVYVLQIALALLTIGRFPAIAIGLFAIVSYGVLIYRHAHELVPTHHR